MQSCFKVSKQKSFYYNSTRDKSRREPVILASLPGVFIGAALRIKENKHSASNIKDNSNRSPLENLAANPCLVTQLPLCTFGRWPVEGKANRGLALLKLFPSLGRGECCFLVVVCFLISVPAPFSFKGSW